MVVLAYTIFNPGMVTTMNHGQCLYNAADILKLTNNSLALTFYCKLQYMYWLRTDNGMTLHEDLDIYLIIPINFHRNHINLDNRNMTMTNIGRGGYFITLQRVHLLITMYYFIIIKSYSNHNQISYNVC